MTSIQRGNELTEKTLLTQTLFRTRIGCLDCELHKQSAFMPGENYVEPFYIQAILNNKLLIYVVLSYALSKSYSPGAFVS